MRDAIADLDPLMGWFPNPVESSTGHPQAKRIGIQLGFASKDVLRVSYS